MGVGVGEDVGIEVGDGDHRVDGAGLNVHDDGRGVAGVPCRVVERLLEEVGDVVLEAGVDGQLHGVTGDGVFRLQRVDRVTLGVLLVGGEAHLPAEVVLVALFEAGDTDGLVEVVAEVGVLLAVFGALGADVAEDVGERGAGGVVAAGGDGELDAGHVGGGLVEHLGLFGGEVLLAEIDGDVVGLVGEGGFHLDLDIEGRNARDLFDLLVDGIAGIFGLGQELGDDRGRVNGHVLDEWIAVAIEDLTARRQDVVLTDVVLVGALGVVGAIDELHVDEADDKDHEESKHGNAEDIEVAVGPVAATAARCPEAFVQDAHKLEAASLKSHAMAFQSYKA